MDTTVDASTKNRVTQVLERFRNLAPIGISLVALVISSLSLFLTQFQPARIQVHPAEFAYVNANEKDLAFHLYLSFTNDGATLGVVQKVAILIQPPGQSGGYLLQAAYFDKLDKGDYASESVVGPIPVDGRSTVTRQIRFISARDTPSDRPLPVRGTYRATVLVWTTSQANQPTTAAPFPFTLSDRDLEDLEAQRLGKRTETIEIHQDQFRSWNAKPINEQEIRDLLKDVT